MNPSNVSSTVLYTVWSLFLRNSYIHGFIMWFICLDSTKFSACSWGINVYIFGAADQCSDTSRWGISSPDRFLHTPVTWRSRAPRATFQLPLRLSVWSSATWHTLGYQRYLQRAGRDTTRLKTDLHRSDTTVGVQERYTTQQWKWY